MNRLNCTVLVFLLLLTTQTSIFGQGEDIALKDTLNLKVKDTPPPKIPKRFFPTALENLGTNILINRYDANLRNVHWAKVTPANWKKNLQTGFEADYDHFSTNWLGHPTHGSYFYNFARSNGYNYWQSIPFTSGDPLEDKVIIWTRVTPDNLQFIKGTYVIGEFNISVVSMEEKTVKSIAQIKKQKAGVSSTVDIDVSNLETGSYYLKIKTDDAVMMRKLIVK